jgi:hypothetical protein
MRSVCSANIESEEAGLGSPSTLSPSQADASQRWDTDQQKRMARIARRYPCRDRRSSAYRWKAVAKDSLERRQAMVRFIREEADIECLLQFAGLAVLAEFRNGRPLDIRAPAVAQANDIPAAPVEIRVRVSPLGFDACDVGTGESIALGVEMHQAFGEFEEPSKSVPKTPASASIASVGEAGLGCLR